MNKESVGQSHHRHYPRYFASLTSFISKAEACLRDEAVKQVRLYWNRSASSFALRHRNLFFPLPCSNEDCESFCFSPLSSQL